MPDFQRTIKTEAGEMPVFLALPDGNGPCPAYIIYMDIFGFREELFGMCRAFSRAGCAAILPDLFYRLGSPRFEPPSSAADELSPQAKAANDQTSMAMSVSDTGAILNALDTGFLKRPINALGTIGYCMGGRHALAAAAAFPDRIDAALSVHGGRMVDDTNSSPHTLLGEITCPTYVAFAENDPTCPDAHQKLIEAEAEASGADILCEHFQAHHGWSFPERWCFDKDASDRVFRQAMTMVGIT